MKHFGGTSTLFVAALLGLQQLSSGFPVATAPKALQGLFPRVEPIFKPEPVVPVSPKPEPVEPAPANPVPKFGDDPAPANPADPAAPPPRFGGDPVPVPDPVPAAPVRATLGTEDELVAMGLTKGTPQRDAFDKFSAWFDSNVAGRTDTPWLFFTKLGDDANAANGARLVPKFQDEFNAGQHRINADDVDAKITNIAENFPLADLPTQIGAAPARYPRFWYDMVGSYGTARLAATTGGKVRLLMPGKELSSTPEGKFWTNYEAYELTKPGTKVTEIWRYNSDNFNEAPQKIWEQNDDPIGKPADFSSEPEQDELLDLGDLGDFKA